MKSSRSMIAVLVVVSFVFVGCNENEIETGAVTGTITVNGNALEGVIVEFVPEAKIRPSSGKTDAEGKYEAQLTANQSGVALGPCLVKFYYYKGDGATNLLPAEWNENASENEDLKIDIPDTGSTFDYDITVEGEFPPNQ